MALAEENIEFCVNIDKKLSKARSGAFYSSSSSLARSNKSELIWRLPGREDVALWHT